MNVISHARSLLNLAQKDLSALRGMENPVVFADEVFGFHAQQAAEKALKAWIAALDLDYPLTHNVAVLLSILEKQGIDVSDLMRFVKYNPFGVTFRYEEVPIADEPLDRESAILEITRLVALADAVVGS